MNSRYARSVQTLLSLVTLFLLISTAHSRSWYSGWSGSNTSDEKDSSPWASMLNVDPSKLITYMINQGGLFVPKSIESDIKVFAKVCHAKQVQLNVVERKLVVRDFSVRMSNQPDDALRIGRVYVRWDSYIRPCIEIEVEDVNILVEFFNVFLTKSNWEELNRNGFPPTFSEYLEAEAAATTSSDELSTFLRIGSIDLSGEMAAQLRSRPLKKELAKLSFSLKMLDAVNREIRNCALENLAKTGRRGCTTDELYTILQKYFGRKVRESLTSAFEDFKTDASTSSEELGRIVKQTKKSILKHTKEAGESVNKYIEDAGDWTGDQVKNFIEERLDKWGESLEEEEGNPQPLFKLAEKLASKHLSSSEGIFNLNRFKKSQSKDHGTNDPGV